MVNATSEYPPHHFCTSVATGCSGGSRRKEGVWGCVFSCRCEGFRTLWMERACKGNEVLVTHCPQWHLEGNIYSEYQWWLTAKSECISPMEASSCWTPILKQFLMNSLTCKSPNPLNHNQSNSRCINKNKTINDIWHLETLLWGLSTGREKSLLCFGAQQPSGFVSPWSPMTSGLMETRSAPSSTISAPHWPHCIPCLLLFHLISSPPSTSPSLFPWLKSQISCEEMSYCEWGAPPQRQGNGCSRSHGHMFMNTKATNPVFLGNTCRHQHCLNLWVYLKNMEDACRNPTRAHRKTSDENTVHRLYHMGVQAFGLPGLDWVERKYLWDTHAI